MQDKAFSPCNPKEEKLASLEANGSSISKMMVRRRKTFSSLQIFLLLLKIHVTFQFNARN